MSVPNLRTDLGAAWDLLRPGTLMYRNAHYLSATLEVDERAMRPWLPWGVSLARPARADLFCAWFPDNTFSPGYYEAGLFVHVKTGLRGRTGIHCPWMIVDDDIALILGREAGGYPKKLGQFHWEQTADRIVARAERRGTTLVEIDARLGEPIPDPPPFLGRPHRNVVGTLGLTLPFLIAFTPRETPVEVHSVDMTLKVTGSERDPLHEMGLGEVVEARLHRVNIAALPPPGLSVPLLPVRPISPLYLLRRLTPRVF